MHCWNKLTLHYKDVLKLPKESLCKQILENQDYKINDSYVIFYIRDRNIFNEDFLKFLKSKDLLLIPFCIGFITENSSKGFIHCDYYGGVDNTIVTEGMPYIQYLTDELSHLMTTDDGRKYWHTSFHMNLGGAGSLEWYQGDTEGEFEKTELKVPVYRFAQEEKLSLVDRLDHHGISICRADVPHRSDNQYVNNNKTRIIVTARFAGNPTYEEVKEKLGDLVIERE